MNLWPMLTTSTKRVFIRKQLKELGRINTQPKVTCLCGFTAPVQYMYRCFYCGLFLCNKCAAVHFSEDKTC